MLVKSYLALASQRAISLALMAIFLALVPALIPAAEFGLYSLILSVVMVVSSGILSFGNQALLRIGREELNLYSQIGRTLATRLVIHAAMLILVCSLFWIVWPDLRAALGIPSQALVFIAVVTIVISFNEMGTVAAQSIGRFTGFGLSSIVLRTMQLGALFVVFVTQSPSWEVLISGAAIGYGVGSLLSFSRISREQLGVFSFDRALLGRMLVFSWSLPFAALSTIMIDWMDIWFVQHFVGIAEAGAYAWVYSLILVARTMTSPLGALMVPLYIDARVQGNHNIGLEILNVSQSTLHLILVFFPVLVGIGIFFLSNINLGDYGQSLRFGAILFPAIIFQVGITFWYPLICTDKALIWKSTGILVIAAGINGVGNLILIPLMGAAGAALSTVLITCFTSFGFLLLLRSTCGGYNSGMFSIICSGIVVVGVCAVSAFLSPITAILLGFCASCVLFAWGRLAKQFSPLGRKLSFYIDGQKGISPRWIRLCLG